MATGCTWLASTNDQPATIRPVSLPFMRVPKSPAARRSISALLICSRYSDSRTASSVA
jgi:hypothetical protein